MLEYLTKYTAKVGKVTKHLGKLFGDVVATVCEYEQEDGVHDLWRRTDHEVLQSAAEKQRLFVI